MANRYALRTTDAGLAGASTASDMRAALGVSGDPGMPSSGLVALWDAADLALSDGDPVGTWAPSVGTPGNLSGAGSGRPTYRAQGSPAGGPCVEFDGSDDELTVTAPVFLPDGADAATVVAIFSRANHNGSFSHVVQYGSGGPAEGRGLGLTPTVWTCLDYQSELPSATADAPRHRRGVVLAHRYDGTTRQLWADGVPVASDAVTLATGASALHVGRSLYGGERAAFRLMLLAIYDAALSDAAMAQIQAHARATRGVP